MLRANKKLENEFHPVYVQLNKVNFFRLFVWNTGIDRFISFQFSTLNSSLLIFIANHTILAHLPTKVCLASFQPTAAAAITYDGVCS